MQIQSATAIWYEFWMHYSMQEGLRPIVLHVLGDEDERVRAILQVMG